MAFERWLIKLMNTISHSLDSLHPTQSTQKRLLTKKSRVGILAFEIAGIMSKLLHLWQSLASKSLSRLRRESICLEGVRKIVSTDDAFLFHLACAELVKNLKMVAESVSRMSEKCSDSSIRCFDRLLDEFANAGHDPHNWIMGSKEIESKNKKLDSFITVTAVLHREMDELSVLENGLKISLQSKDLDAASIKEQKIVLQRQKVKYLKEKSLWSRSFDYVTPILVRYVFTILARMKLVFGVGKSLPPLLPRNLSSSALVHPSENMDAGEFLSTPLMKNTPRCGFFESNFKTLEPNSSALGAVGLALRHANLINVIEKMIKSPKLVGIDARDDLYSMLPNSIRLALRARLKGVAYLASDPVLASEWRDALHKILGWLAPLAHNMIKWESERSFEQRNLGPKNNVLLLQTLYFADFEKAEAAIVELLIGLNYIWRFEKEMKFQ